MNGEHLTIYAILAATLGLFVWGRWRADVIAVAALIATVLTGLIEPAQAFLGFGHPAVITVAAVLAVSAALGASGVIDLIAQKVISVANAQFTQMVALCLLAGILSGFMNNVGALALLMPVALATARKTGYSPTLVLMPLSFAAILGGLTTLIGTPPNIIVAGYRRGTGEVPFGMFDFSPVGVPLAIAGILFLVLLGWRFIPRGREGQRARGDFFQVSDYLAEMRVKEDSSPVGKTIADLDFLKGADLTVIDLLRNEAPLGRWTWREPLRDGDVLLVRADSETLEEVVQEGGFELVADERLPRDLKAADLTIVEAVVSPHSWIDGWTPAQLSLPSRYRVNLLAVARQGQALKQRLRDISLRAGDVLLVQGETDTLPSTIAALGCLPLVARGLKFQPRRTLLPVAIFATAITAIAAGFVSPAVALVIAVFAMVVTQILPAREVYTSIDWQVIVLLGAMIPVGGALQTTGAAQAIAASLADLAGNLSPYLLLAVLIAFTMTLSDVMNNAATAVVMSPIAIGLAEQFGVSGDPLLMGVAVGASSAFLTPIGHQNNLLVMGPGGYRFGDYWRVGLPLELVLLALAVALIPVVWPFAQA